METWIIPLVLIVLAYLLEFTRPWVTSFIKKSSLSLSERRLYILSNRYNLIKTIIEFPSGVNLLVFKAVVFGIMVVTALIMFIGQRVIEGDILFPVVDKGIIFFLGFMGLFVLSHTYNILYDATNFSKFRSKVNRRYKQLGGNPEDLDKEETAGG